MTVLNETDRRVFGEIRDYALTITEIVRNTGIRLADVRNVLRWGEQYGYVDWRWEWSKKSGRPMKAWYLRDNGRRVL